MVGRQTNFKTYEAQSRLLAAVVAAHPELKLNFKAIAEHFGSTTTASAIEHRFRPIKEVAKAFRAARARGEDTDDIGGPAGRKDGDELAKHFGESTPDGLSFQFRDIKRGAKGMQEAVREGTDPVAGYHAAISSPATPGSSRRGRPRNVAPSSGASSARTSKTTGGGRGGRGVGSSGAVTSGATSTRKRPRKNYKETSTIGSDESDGAEIDWSGQDDEETPTKRPRHRRAGDSTVDPAAIALNMNMNTNAPIPGSSASTPVIVNSPPTESDYSTVATPSGTFTDANTTGSGSFAAAPASFTGASIFGSGGASSSHFEPHIKQELQTLFPDENLGIGAFYDHDVDADVDDGQHQAGGGYLDSFEYADHDNGEV